MTRKAKKTKESHLDELRGYFKTIASLVNDMMETESQLEGSIAGKSLAFMRVEVFRVCLMFQGALSQLESETRNIML